MYWFLWIPGWLVCFISGIISCQFPPFTIKLILFCGFFLLIIYLSFYQYRNSLSLLLAVLISLASFGMGFARLSFSKPALNQLLPILNQPVALCGTVIDYPVCKTRTIEFQVQNKKNRFIAILPNQSATKHIDVMKGDRITATGTFTLQKSHYSSPLSDSKKLQLSNSIAFFEIKDTNSISIDRSHLSSHLHRMIQSIRDKAWKKLSSYSLDNQYIHFLGALWLGLEKENFPMQVLFQKIGLSHVLAISGSNFYWLAGLLLAVFTYLKWKEKEKSIFIMVFLFFYCALVGFQASVIRAWLMISLMLFARSRLEGYHSLYAMMYSAWIMLFWNPLWLFDIGFQLSFIGCTAFIFFSEPVLKSIGATVTTTPLVAYRFHMISTSSLITNLLILPVLSYFYLLVWPFFLPGKTGFIFLKAGEWCWQILVILMEWVSSLPFSFFHIKTLPLWMLLIYYGFLFGSLLWVKYAVPAKRISFLTVLLLFLLPVFMISVPRTSPYLTVTYFNVGQGDAALIQTPNGKNILIDTGPGKKENVSFDPGEKILLPLLRKAGVNKLDLVIISHYHDDHYGGLPSVMQHIPVVKQMVIPNTNSQDSVIFRQRFADWLDKTNIIQWCGHHQWRFDDLQFELFSPECNETEWNPGENSRSLCFSVQYHSISFLFTGDNESDTEAQLVDQYGERLRCNILKIPHHGSQTSSSPSFLETVSPALAVISCGPKALFRHPSASTIIALEESGIPYHITNVNGNLQVISDGNNLEMIPERR